MKGSLLSKSVLLFVITPELAFGQFTGATFQFFNYAPAVKLDAPVFDAGGNPLFGTNYVAVLYGGATTDSLAPATIANLSMQPVAFTSMHNGQAGYFAEGHFVTVDNRSCGGYAWLQVRAWDSRLGATYDEVASLGLGGYGESPLFYALGGDACSATGRVPQALIGLQSFSLVPEPGTWALLVLGGGFLFWRWRRRK
jgi:hypothetical protein